MIDHWNEIEEEEDRWDPEEQEEMLKLLKDTRKRYEKMVRDCPGRCPDNQMEIGERLHMTLSTLHIHSIS